MFQILKAHLFVLLATFLVAGSFIVSGKLSGVINPISLTLFRFFAATLIFAPIIGHLYIKVPNATCDLKVA